MSVTIKTVISGVRYDADAIAAALKRFGLKQDSEFFVSANASHHIIGFRDKVETSFPPVGVWIVKAATPRLCGEVGKCAYSETGFRANEDGDLEVIGDDADKKQFFNAEFQKGFVRIVKVEALKKAARKKGYKKFFEQAVGNKIKLYVQ